MKPARLARTLHKWLALTVGVQAFLWLVSGFYMVVVDLDFIHGDTLVRNVTMPAPRAASLHPVGELRTRFRGIEEIRLKGLPGFAEPLYEVRLRAGTELLDAASGARLSPLPESRIRALARAYYAGTGSLARLDRLTGTPPLEIQGRALPLWRADFDDWHETSLYIHPDTGTLVTRRHRAWRWFDAFWMLHIMDYDERTNVNNGILRFATVAGLVFVASGLWLLVFSFRLRGRART